MTAKEKAQELISNFHYQICNDCGLSESDSTEVAAKACAKLSVNETIQTLNEVKVESDIDKLFFWKEVLIHLNA